MATIIKIEGTAGTVYLTDASGSTTAYAVHSFAVRLAPDEIAEALARIDAMGEPEKKERQRDDDRPDWPRPHNSPHMSDSRDRQPRQQPSSYG